MRSADKGTAIRIRLFHEQDAEQIARLFHQTVREINLRDYSLNQVKAWAPDNIHFRNGPQFVLNNSLTLLMMKV
jgi:hypothetical protein